MSDTSTRETLEATASAQALAAYEAAADQLAREVVKAKAAYRAVMGTRARECLGVDVMAVYDEAE